VALLPAALSAATEIHLSPSGIDANPGTAALPVATPQAAQVRVRSLIQAGLSDAVDVIFAAGTYVMDAPLELRPEDSGTAAFPITWKAATGAEVILDGGKRITGPWTDSGGGIWFTDLTGVGLAANQWNFRQLFVDGSRATRARFPNKSEPNPFLYATGGGFDHAMVDPAWIKASWGSAADAQLNMVPQSRFFNQWNTVTAVNTGTGRIDISDSERHRLIDSGSWFWVEGVREELDEPGEWFLDPATGRLSYMPPVGVDPNTRTIIAPFLNRIVNVKGDVNANTHVAHVHFDGLKFRHTTFTLGQIEARVHTDTAIMFENTRDSSVRNCHFDNIGGYALWLHLDSQRNAFDHNTVEYSGGGGVLLTGARFSYMDDTKIYTPGEAAAKVAPILNGITRNTVEHCGKIRYYGGGVHLDSRPFNMSMAPGNYIAHNLFNKLSRNGIFAFRNQGGNVVEYNHIHNVMLTTVDAGCIHFATMNTLNAPNFILNNWLHDVWGYEQKPDGNVDRRQAHGVYLDWETSNTTVKDNWIYNYKGNAVAKVFGGNRNLVIGDNPSSATAITPPFVAEVGPDGTATHGIDLANNRFIGSVIPYTDSGHFSSTGTWTEETATGIFNLFEFDFLTGTAAVPSQATYTLPITEDGVYQISLLYKPGNDRASNVPIAIQHADGTANLVWNMRQGSNFGFAVPVGTYRFVASQTNTVTLSTTGVNGKVIADSVGFVNIGANEPPVAADVRITGSAQAGGTLTGSYTYSDADNDPEGNSQFRWYRSEDAVFDEGDSAIPGAISRNYTAQPADATKYLFFEVTPVALSGLTNGAPARSGATAQIASNDPPTANGVSVSGTAQVGAGLTGSYVYNDADGDPEGASFFRWYRSNDAVLDPGDTIVAGEIEVVPSAVKTSTALNAQRFCDNLFNSSGMTASAEVLFNLDASQPGEPASADGVSWTTPSGGEAALLAGRKVWWVADLGASRALNEVRIWNFQWNHSTGDLSNRGISQFDLYLRDSMADTDDGTSGGAVINPQLSVTAFNPGSSNPWQAVMIDQTLARAPNTDTYAGQTFPLAGQTGRFLAFVADSYHGGNGVALGKVRVRAGESTANYTPVADDSGKYLIFAVTPVAASGISQGSALWAVRGPIGSEANSAPAASNVEITGTAATGETLQGSYAYFDAEGDEESGTIFRWLRSNDGMLDGGDVPVGTARSYVVQPADAGKRLFFEVTPKAAGGTPSGSPAASAGVFVPNPGPTGQSLLIEESFGGSESALAGKPADAFDSALTLAGGSATWVADDDFRANGVVNGVGAGSAAYLSLGSFINDAKGTATGRFTLVMTISETTANWLSLGFAAESAPNVLKNFTNTGTGSATTTGVGTIVYRAQNAAAEAGGFDMWGGGTTTGNFDGPDGNSGLRTFTVQLDLTPAGGYNGTNHFGKVTWFDAALGPLGTFIYTAARNFGAILISQAGGSTGTISALSLYQQELPANTYASWIGGFAFAGFVNPDLGATGDPDHDGLPNAVENLMGSSPEVFSPGLTAVASSDGTLVFRHTLNATPAGDLQASYEWSTNLVNWNAGGATAGGTTVTFSDPPVVITPGTPDLVEIAATVSGIALTGIFARCKATLTPEF
jgi:hypothetical protein